MLGRPQNGPDAMSGKNASPIACQYSGFEFPYIIPQFTSLRIYWEMVGRGVDLSGSQQAPVSIYQLLNYISVHGTMYWVTSRLSQALLRPRSASVARHWASTHLGLSTTHGAILCIIMPLGAFEKLRRATISFITSVHLQGTIRLPLGGLSWI